MPPRKRAAAKRAPAQGGRPRKLEIDPDLMARIVARVKRGAPPERAAVAEGVAASSHYAWQAKGLEEREHREAGKAPRKTWQVFLDYAARIEQALAVAELDLLEDVREGGDGWQASLAILERRFRTDWAPKALDAAVRPAAAQPSASVSSTGLDQLAQRRAARRGKST